MQRGVLAPLKRVTYSIRYCRGGQASHILEFNTPTRTVPQYARYMAGVFRASLNKCRLTTLDSVMHVGAAWGKRCTGLRNAARKKAESTCKWLEEWIGFVLSAEPRFSNGLQGNNQGGT
jgi:hypothetical protein